MTPASFCPAVSRRWTQGGWKRAHRARDCRLPAVCHTSSTHSSKSVPAKRDSGVHSNFYRRSVSILTKNIVDSGVLNKVSQIVLRIGFVFVIGTTSRWTQGGWKRAHRAGDCQLPAVRRVGPEAAAMIVSRPRGRGWRIPCMRSMDESPHRGRRLSMEGE